MHIQRIQLYFHSYYSLSLFTRLPLFGRDVRIVFRATVHVVLVVGISAGVCAIAFPVLPRKVNVCKIENMHFMRESNTFESMQL